MAFVKTTTLVRTNPAVNFFKPDDAVILHTRDVYSNGPVAKLLGISSEISADRLTLVVKQTFVNEAAYNEWIADPIVFANRVAQQNYNANNGITSTED